MLIKMRKLGKKGQVFQLEHILFLTFGLAALVFGMPKVRDGIRSLVEKVGDEIGNAGQKITFLAAP